MEMVSHFSGWWGALMLRLLADIKDYAQRNRTETRDDKLKARQISTNKVPIFFRKKFFIHFRTPRNIGLDVTEESQRPIQNSCNSNDYEKYIHNINLIYSLINQTRTLIMTTPTYSSYLQVGYRKIRQNLGSGLSIAHWFDARCTRYCWMTCWCDSYRFHRHLQTTPRHSHRRPFSYLDYARHCMSCRFADRNRYRVRPQLHSTHPRLFPQSLIRPAQRYLLQPLTLNRSLA